MSQDRISCNGPAWGKKGGDDPVSWYAGYSCRCDDGTPHKEVANAIWAGNARGVLAFHAAGRMLRCVCIVIIALLLLLMSARESEKRKSGRKRGPVPRRGLTNDINLRRGSFVARVLVAGSLEKSYLVRPETGSSVPEGGRQLYPCRRGCKAPLFQQDSINVHRTIGWLT